MSYINPNNLCTFNGRITNEPRFSQIPAGTDQNGQQRTIDKVFFTLTVDRKMSSAQKKQAENNGEKTVDFVSFSAIGSDANFVKNYCPKGKSVSVVAAYKTYTKTNARGEQEYGHVFEVNSISFGINDSKSLGDNGNGSSNYQNGYNSYKNNPAPVQDNSDFVMFDEDSMPF